MTNNIYVGDHVTFPMWYGDVRGVVEVICDFGMIVNQGFGRFVFINQDRIKTVEKVPMTLFECQACKETVLNLQDETPRSCKKCGSGPIFMKPVKGKRVTT